MLHVRTGHGTGRGLLESGPGAGTLRSADRRPRPDRRRPSTTTLRPSVRYATRRRRMALIRRMGGGSRLSVRGGLADEAGAATAHGTEHGGARSAGRRAPERPAAGPGARRGHGTWGDMSRHHDVVLRFHNGLTF